MAKIGSITITYDDGSTVTLGTASTPPPATPSTPPTTPPSAPPPPPSTTPTTRLDAHFQNVVTLYREGPRGRFLSNYYLSLGASLPYKSPLQSRIAAFLTAEGDDYAHWADPQSFNQEFAYSISYGEFLRLATMASEANKLLA